MSSFSEILFTPLGVTLRLAAMLLVVLQLFLLLYAHRLRRGAVCLCLNALHALFGMILLVLLLDAAYILYYLPYARTWPAAVVFVRGLPWPVIAAAELIMTGLAAWSAQSSVRFAARHPSVQSVKQTVDLLPTGVCIADEDGTVLLSNLRMNEIARALTGSRCTDVRPVLAAARERGEPQGEKLLLRLPDGVLLLEESELDLEGRRFTQVTAEDVSEQYRATAELEAKNARLRDLQDRLKGYRQRQTELVIRQELLAARTTVHNQLGGALLTGKYHLEHPGDTDAEALRLLLWQINTYLLSEVEEPEIRTDELEAALRLAEGIGVRVALNGTPPAAGPLRSLLAQAVTECAANTVKHAHGDRLTVTVTAPEPGRTAFEIEGSGVPPRGEIVPTGGLRSLELCVTQAGGRMTLQSVPVFCLKIEL